MEEHMYWNCRTTWQSPPKNGRAPLLLGWQSSRSESWKTIPSESWAPADSIRPLWPSKMSKLNSKVYTTTKLQWTMQKKIFHTKSSLWAWLLTTFECFTTDSTHDQSYMPSRSLKLLSYLLSRLIIWYMLTGNPTLRNNNYRFPK